MDALVNTDTHQSFRGRIVAWTTVGGVSYPLVDCAPDLVPDPPPEPEPVVEPLEELPPIPDLPPPPKTRKKKD